VGSNGGSELGGTTHREGRLAAALRPISMAWRRLPALELLHGVMGKVVEETGAQAWMRGKWGKKKGTERRPAAFQAARWRGVERVDGEGGPVGTTMWRRRREEGGSVMAVGNMGWLAMAPGRRARAAALPREQGKEAGVGDVVWVAGAWAQARCGTRCQRRGA
jgi:hypothetical protein